MVIKNSTSQHTHTIKADGKPIVNELSVIEGKIAELRKTQDALTRNTKEWTATAKEINKLSAEADTVRNSMGLMGMTMGQLIKLQKELTAEYKQFGINGEKLKEVNTYLKEHRDSISATVTTVQQSETTWGKLKGWILGAFTIGAILEFGRAMIDFGKSVFDVGAKFEKYQVVLTKAFGSQELAKKSMAELQDLAKNTPFTLDELTGSYVKFINRGLMPSMESMTKLGDVAASQGKGFDQLTEAILDAGTGEFERLKEFGIAAKKNGDQVELSFKGVHKTVKMTPEAMQGAIESFGELDTVSGMMAETMKTGEGNLSNINDKIDAVKVELYNGLTPVFRTLFSVVNTGWDIFRGFTNLLMAVPNFVRENKDVFIGLAGAILTLNANGIINNATVLRATILEKGRAAATAISNGVTVLLNNTVRANPIMAMVSGVMLLVTALVAWYNRSEDLRARLAGLWEMVKVLSVAFTNFFVGLATFDAKKMIASFEGLGTNLSKAYNSGFNKSMAESKAAAAIEKRKEDAAAAKAAKAQADAEAKIKKDADAKLLAEKAAANKKHREEEAAKAKKATDDDNKAAEKAAEEYLKIREKLNDSVDKINEEFIDDDWKRKENAILREYQKTLAANKKTLDEFEGSIEQKKKLEAEFANYELALYGKVERDLAKLQADRKAAEEKFLEESKKTWKTALDKKGADIIELNKKLQKDGDDYVHDEGERAKKLADRRKEMFDSLLSFVNDSFNDTIQTLESIDTAYAQTQANRIKAIQAGFQQIQSAVASMKIDTTKLFTIDKDSADGFGAQFVDNIGEGLKNAFSANPVKFLGAAKKIIDGINGVFEANRWAKFEVPLRKIIDDSLAAIEDMGKTLEIKMKALEAEGDKLLNQNNANRDKLTAAALDFEAKQFAMLVKSQEDLNRINLEYAQEELRIKNLYADELNSADAERAEKARGIVDGLIRDLKVARNEELEALIGTENSKKEIEKSSAEEIAKINQEADAELAELAKTAADRTLEEQQALINAVEAKRTAELAKVATDRQAELTKLQDYKTQEAEINRLADEAILAAKAASNDKNIAEQQRLVDAIEEKRKLDLANLASSDLGILHIKEQTAAAIKQIEETSAAESFRIESDLKNKQIEAERIYNLQMYAQQLAAWEAERNLTIGILQLQLIKANGKIFNKKEAQAIQEALNAAAASLPPPPPAGVFNTSSSGGNNGSGASGGGGNNNGNNGQKYEQGGFFEAHTGQTYANGGLAYGPSHSNGGIKLVDSQTGHVRGEMEGGEYIINKRATAANMALLSRINNSGIIGRVANSSFARKGQPAFEDGGVFSTFGPITLNQSNSMAAETVQILNNIAKATGATADASIKTASNTDATAKNTQASLQPLNEAANNSRNLGSIAQATRDTANKDFRPNISIINQQLGRLADIEASARL